MSWFTCCFLCCPSPKENEVHVMALDHQDVVMLPLTSEATLHISPLGNRMKKANRPLQQKKPKKLRKYPPISKKIFNNEDSPYRIILQSSPSSTSSDSSDSSSIMSSNPMYIYKARSEENIITIILEYCSFTCTDISRNASEIYTYLTAHSKEKLSFNEKIIAAIYKRVSQGITTLEIKKDVDPEKSPSVINALRYFPSLTGLKICTRHFQNHHFSQLPVLQALEKLVLDPLVSMTHEGLHSLFFVDSEKQYVRFPQLKALYLGNARKLLQENLVNHGGDTKKFNTITQRITKEIFSKVTTLQVIQNAWYTMRMVRSKESQTFACQRIEEEQEHKSLFQRRIDRYSTSSKDIKKKELTIKIPEFYRGFIQVGENFFSENCVKYQSSTDYIDTNFIDEHPFILNDEESKESKKE